MGRNQVGDRLRRELPALVGLGHTLRVRALEIDPPPGHLLVELPSLDIKRRPPARLLLLHLLPIGVERRLLASRLLLHLPLHQALTAADAHAPGAKARVPEMPADGPPVVVLPARQPGAIGGLVMLLAGASLLGVRLHAQTGMDLDHVEAAIGAQLRHDVKMDMEETLVDMFDHALEVIAEIALSRNRSISFFHMR